MKDSVLYISLVAASKYVGAGLAVIGVVGAGIGIGIIFAGYMISVTRNPYLQNALLRYLFLGFALTEAMGLLSIMMAFFDFVCLITCIYISFVYNYYKWTPTNYY